MVTAPRRGSSIRYNSNGGRSRSSGVANRRYREANLFGLYDDDALTEAGSKAAYRMFTRHKPDILPYETQFDPTNTTCRQYPH